MLEVAPPRYDSSDDVTLDCEIFPFGSDTNARPPAKFVVKTVLAAPGNAARALAAVKYSFVPSATAVVVRGWKLLSPRQYCDVVPVAMPVSLPPNCVWMLEVAPERKDSSVAETGEASTFPEVLDTSALLIAKFTDAMELAAPVRIVCLASICVWALLVNPLMCCKLLESTFETATLPFEDDTRILSDVKFADVIVVAAPVTEACFPVNCIWISDDTLAKYPSVVAEMGETAIFPSKLETTTLFGSKSSWCIVDAAPSITVPSRPAGSAKSRTASVDVPPFVTLAFEPGGSVVIVPIENVAGPCSPRSPRGKAKSRTRSVSVPVFVTVALLVSGTVTTFPMRNVAGPISPRGPGGPGRPIELVDELPRTWFWTFFTISKQSCNKSCFFFRHLCCEYLGFSIGVGAVPKRVSN